MNFGKFLPLLIFGSFILLLGCEHDNPNPHIPDPDPVDTTIDPVDTTIIPVDTTDYGIPCDPDTVYFGNDILPLFVSSCALSGCHDETSAQNGVILTSYQNVINTGDVTPYNLDAGHLYEMITEPDEDMRMPPLPYSRLSNDDINKIAIWILQGAKNNQCDENAQPCDVSNVTFSATVQPLINQKCKGCHSGNTPSGGIAMTTFDQVQSIASTGRLFGAISWHPGYTPMPKDQPKLPDCDILKIKTWIDAGMPNN